MPKARTTFVCRSCGGMQPKWMGKCPDCGAWDSLDEVSQSVEVSADAQRGLAAGLVANLDDSSSELDSAPTAIAVPLSHIPPDDVSRQPTGISEFDRVLGGGLVPGSVVLLGGEPGIGKSTLLLQAAGRLAASAVPVLYVTSEESARQVQLRARRLDNLSADDYLYVLADTNLARIFEQVRRVKPAVLLIDSIQMVYKSSVDAAPGSVTQLRRCATDLVFLAKASGICVILVGHVTKEGTVAGPRLLEHLVDAVLYFEGDTYHAHRLVRAVKNRFGATLEIGLFEMTGSGLRPIEDGGGVLAEQTVEQRPGSAVCPVMQGSRCFHVEIQALTATGILGAAKRKVSGLDASRLALLIAVLEKHADLRLADQDVFAQAAGGLKVVEPAADLAILASVASAYLRRTLPPHTILAGEVGLGGQVRRVSQLEHRLREAARLGFRHAIVSRDSAASLRRADSLELTLHPVAHVGQVIELLRKA